MAIKYSSMLMSFLNGCKKLNINTQEKGKKMNLEIVEAYPRMFNKKIFAGTIHVFLIDEQIDIRGVMFSKNGNHTFVDLPYIYGYDRDDNKFVKYPMFQFFQPEKNKDLIQTIRTKALAYVLENWENFPICKPMYRKENTKKIKKEKPPFMSMSAYKKEKNENNKF